MITKRLLNLINEKIISPTAKSVAVIGISRAMFDALLFLPSTARTIVGVSSVGIKAFKDYKGQLAKKKQEIGKQYDQLLEKMETKTDKDGNVIEKKFSKKEIEIIKAFFSKKRT